MHQTAWITGMEQSRVLNRKVLVGAAAYYTERPSLIEPNLLQHRLLLIKRMARLARFEIKLAIKKRRSQWYESHKYWSYDSTVHLDHDKKTPLG